MSTIMAITPNEVRGIRQRLKLTQAELAERLHLTRDAVAHWENGRCSPSGPAEILLRQLGSLAGPGDNLQPA
jgi:DNA-binding transcriptional regulator YiaG